MYAHNYEEEERKKSTCEEPGYVKSVCSECGETKTDVTEKMNHSFPAGTEIKYDYMDNSNENYCYNAYRECDRCHKDVFYKTKSHSMDKDVENHVEATCATTGVNAKKCRYCSRKTTEITPVNPLKHERGSVVYRVDRRQRQMCIRDRSCTAKEMPKTVPSERRCRVLFAERKSTDGTNHVTTTKKKLLRV